MAGAQGNVYEDLLKMHSWLVSPLLMDPSGSGLSACPGAPDGRGKGFKDSMISLF